MQAAFADAKCDAAAKVDSAIIQIDVLKNIEAEDVEKASTQIRKAMSDDVWSEDPLVILSVRFDGSLNDEVRVTAVLTEQNGDRTEAE